MKCTICGYVTAMYPRYCPGCNADLGFPNVTLAESPLEHTALSKRLSDAEISTTVRGCRIVLDSFGDAALRSQVVIARSLGLIQWLLNSENQLYVSYYRQVHSGARIPEDNEWDPGRAAAESTISPYFYTELVYGALSLDGRGVKAFGAYSMVLRDNNIRLRTTLFEENSFLFCTRQKISAGKPAPAGYRASWSRRDALAKAKLHSRLDSETVAAKFPQVLLRDADDPIEADFIEAQIYGPIHQSAIERVVGPRPTSGPQRVIWKSVEASLKKIGASMEVV